MASMSIPHPIVFYQPMCVGLYGRQRTPASERRVSERRSFLARRHPLYQQILFRCSFVRGLLVSCIRQNAVMLFLPRGTYDVKAATSESPVSPSRIAVSVARKGTLILAQASCPWFLPANQPAPPLLPGQATPKNTYLRQQTIFRPVYGHFPLVLFPSTVRPRWPLSSAFPVAVEFQAFNTSSSR